MLPKPCSCKQLNASRAFYLAWAGIYDNGVKSVTFIVFRDATRYRPGQGLCELEYDFVRQAVETRAQWNCEDLNGGCEHILVGERKSAQKSRISLSVQLQKITGRPMSILIHRQTPKGGIQALAKLGEPSIAGFWRQGWSEILSSGSVTANLKTHHSDLSVPLNCCPRWVILVHSLYLVNCIEGCFLHCIYIASVDKRYELSTKDAANNTRNIIWPKRQPCGIKSNCATKWILKFTPLSVSYHGSCLNRLNTCLNHQYCIVY